jgi:glucose dehydrogenase
VLRNAGNVADDSLPGSWLTYGRNQSETRFSALKQINETNAKRLGLAWSYVIGAGGGNQEGTPIVWNNTLYGITTWSAVYALDARTVATAGNQVFEVINDGRFRAVTADKGEILYEIKTGRTDMAPPITYAVDVKQYVAFQGGLGRLATIGGPNDDKVDNPPILFVFALDGTAELPKLAPPPPNNRPPAPEPEH